MAKLTIVTPTFNRAHTLPRCYDSLLKQTCWDFEWIIVDDGSTDNTQDVISGFDTDLFQVIKIRKEKGGKHTALNASHPYIHGDYVLILDSDDYLTDTAVNEVLSGWSVYREEMTVGILAFLKGTSESEPVCTVADYETPVEVLRYRRQSRIGNDCCGVIRTEIFLKYPFPVYEGEKFISECALWNRAGRDYKCVYIDSVIYLCEYMEDGLTRSGRSMRIRNPKGGMYTSNLRMDRRNYFGQRCKYALLYTCYGHFAHKGFRQQMKETDYPILAAVCYPFGLLLYLLWNHKYR